MTQLLQNVFINGHDTCLVKDTVSTYLTIKLEDTSVDVNSQRLTIIKLFKIS